MNLLRKLLVRVGHTAISKGYRLPSSDLVDRFNELAYLKDILDRLKVNVIIDVGANKGYYAEHLRCIGYNGYIFSFEPIEQDVEEIRIKSADDPKWHAISLALGAKSTEQVFSKILAGNATTLSSFLTSKTPFEATETETMKIERLDYLTADLLESIVSPRIFLKTDTQGFDLEVWKGAEAIYPQIVGLQSEISVTPLYEGMPHYTKSLEFFEDLGFTLMTLFVVSRTKKKSILEYDCIMARIDEIDV